MPATQRKKVTKTQLTLRYVHTYLLQSSIDFVNDSVYKATQPMKTLNFIDTISFQVSLGWPTNINQHTFDMTKSVVIISNNFHTDLHNLIIKNLSMISNFNYLYNYFHFIKEWIHINWTKQEHSHICESIMPSMRNLSKNYLPQLGFFYTNISPQLQLNCFKLLKHLQLEILISYVTMWQKNSMLYWTCFTSFPHSLIHCHWL